MKTTLYKVAIILFLIPAISLGNQGWKGKYTKEKKINKEYNVSASALLKVKNSFGNLYITSWNQNKVVIEVHIQTNGDNEERVQNRLNEINVDFEASNSMVYARTTFGDNKSKSWWGGKKNRNVNMKINYTIKLPASNSVDLSNDYGQINLDRLEGVAKISCDYGKITLGELLAENNSLSFDYTSKSSIEYMKSGKINADYSSFELERAGNLVVNADYSNSKINDAKALDYNADYGSLVIDNVGNIKGNGDYITTKIGHVNGNVSINADYGAIRIAHLDENAGNVDIKSDYTGIKIGYAAGYNFNFEVKMGYAGFKGGEDFEYNIKRVKSGEKYYKGYRGSSNGKNVNITADYGSVTFYKN